MYLMGRRGAECWQTPRHGARHEAPLDGAAAKTPIRWNGQAPAGHRPQWSLPAYTHIGSVRPARANPIAL